MFSWFSTLPLCALCHHHQPWKRQKMLNWRRSSVSRGMNLNSAVMLHNKQHANLLHVCNDFLSLRFHQKQLLEETRGGCPSPPRPTQLDVERHSPTHPVPQEGAREVKHTSAPAPAAAPSVRETGKTVSLSLCGAFPEHLFSLFLFTGSCDVELYISR